MVDFAELPPPPGTRFGPVRLVAETGSTNADLLERARAGDPEGAVLVTDHQRAGRGRQQRVWHDEPGNSLLVSVLLRPSLESASLLPLVAGLAAVDAVTDLVGDAHQVGLKWPNDVLVPTMDERKLAGILAEATSTPGSSHGHDHDHDRGTGDGDLAVVVGMGLNLQWVSRPPAEIERRVVTLSAMAGTPVDRDEVLARYLAGLERWLAALEADDGVLAAYRARCLTLGRQVRFTTVTGEHHGRAVAVTDQGKLVLETTAGERVELNAGDAHHV